MTPEQIVATPPLVLPLRERERYFEDGFLTAPASVGVAWLAAARRQAKRDGHNVDLREPR